MIEQRAAIFLELKGASKAINTAGSLIRKGKIIAFPTETVYGLGADAFNPRAVARIFAIKERPRFDPLIVHISDLSQIDAIAEDIPDKARTLIDRFWPGPLTIILPKKPTVPDIVTSGLPNVAIRMPAHAIALELIRAAQTPLAAPSANKFGGISPTCAAHVREQFHNKIEMTLDGGSCTVGVESTIIGFADSFPVLLRPGGTPLEDIQRAIGDVVFPSKYSMTKASPGRQPRHYAPATPLTLRTASQQFPGLRKGLLSFTRPEIPLPGEYAAIEILSPKGDLAEAASRLFAAMRRLDSLGLDVIVATSFPDWGIGLAINDRLTRASQPKKRK